MALRTLRATSKINYLNKMCNKLLFVIESVFIKTIMSFKFFL